MSANTPIHYCLLVISFFYFVSCSGLKSKDTHYQQSLEGSVVNLQCTLKFKGKKLSWEYMKCSEFNETLCVTSENGAWITLPYRTNKIILKNVTTSQSGLYRCKKPATDLIDVYSTIELRVIGFETGEDLRTPSFPENMTDRVKVPLRGRVTLQCTVISRTTPTIIWLHEGFGLINYKGNFYNLVNSTGEMSPSPHTFLSKTVIKNITPEKAGNYYCLAINTKGFSAVRTYIELISNDLDNNKQSNSLYLLYLMPFGLAFPAILLWCWYIRCSNFGAKSTKSNSAVDYIEIRDFQTETDVSREGNLSRCTV